MTSGGEGILYGPCLPPAPVGYLVAAVRVELTMDAQYGLGINLGQAPGGVGALVAGLKALPEGVPHPARTARPSPGVLEGDVIVGVNGAACAALRDIVTAIRATTGSLGLIVYRRA